MRRYRFLLDLDDFKFLLKSLGKRRFFDLSHAAAAALAFPRQVRCTMASHTYHDGRGGAAHTGSAVNEGVWCPKLNDKTSIQPMVCSLYVLLQHRCDREEDDRIYSGRDFAAANKGLICKLSRIEFSSFRWLNAAVVE